MQISIVELRQATNITAARAQEYCGALNFALEAFGITGDRVPYFLADVGHECQDFARFEENLNYSAAGLVKTFKKYFPTVAVATPYAMRPAMIASKVYANRNGNGNEASREGYIYRGRGAIQCTGKKNYEAVTDWLERYDCPDFVEYPMELAKPYWAIMSAAAWWAHNALNKYADQGNQLYISKTINQGSIRAPGEPNGWSDRQARLRKAKAAIKAMCK